MVARDGIEPPTPAFSGPRSTTELSGLGMTLVVGDRQEPPRANLYICCPGPFRGACRWRKSATQTHSKYSNPPPYRQLTRLALSFLITPPQGRPCSLASEALPLSCYVVSSRRSRKLPLAQWQTPQQRPPLQPQPRVSSA